MFFRKREGLCDSKGIQFSRSYLLNALNEIRSGIHSNPGSQKYGLNRIKRSLAEVLPRLILELVQNFLLDNFDVPACVNLGVGEILLEFSQRVPMFHKRLVTITNFALCQIRFPNRNEIADTVGPDPFIVLPGIQSSLLLTFDGCILRDVQDTDEKPWNRVGHILGGGTGSHVLELLNLARTKLFHLVSQHVHAVCLERRPRKAVDEDALGVLREKELPKKHFDDVHVSDESSGTNCFAPARGSGKEVRHDDWGRAEAAGFENES
jgi:hypothetical protein